MKPRASIQCPPLSDITIFVSLLTELSRRRRSGIPTSTQPVSVEVSTPTEKVSEEQGASTVDASPSTSLRADYDIYCVARDTVGPSLQRFLTAQAFARLPKERDGSVSIFHLAQYIRTKVVFHYAVGRLLTYDTQGDRCLRENDLETYIFEAISGVPEISSLQENFFPFFVYTAVRKFFFFLDPNHTGKINIRTLACSRAFAEWTCMLPNGHPDLGPSGRTLIHSNSRGRTLLGSSNSAQIKQLRSLITSSGSPELSDVNPEKSITEAEKIVHSCWQGNNSARTIGVGLSVPTTPVSPVSPSSPRQENVSWPSALGLSPLSPPSASAVVALSASPPPSPPLPVPQPLSSSSAPLSVQPSSVLMENTSALQNTSLASNWFSAANALRVYSQYLQLDADQNGMLSRRELSAYQNGILTQVCIERIFEECNTFSGEIDFRVYLDIVLALENRSAKASQRFLFKLLDINHVGRVGLSEVRYFFSHVAAQLQSMGHEAVDVANVCDEVMDMVRPKRQGSFTLTDLIDSKVGGIACGILLDTAAFILYDKREEIRALTFSQDEPTTTKSPDGIFDA
jgi:Ca2+-binding EF-hand superfamily protein